MPTEMASARPNVAITSHAPLRFIIFHFDHKTIESPLLSYVKSRWGEN
jgi:hypothetical protein